MFPKHPLIAFANQVGFQINDNTGSGMAQLVQVPCIFLGGIAGTCTISASYDPATKKANTQLTSADHAVRITTDEAHDGRVYEANGSPIGNYLRGDGSTWSDISVKKGAPNRPETDETVYDLLCRYAMRIVGAASSANNLNPKIINKAWPFNIPNTFEDRAAIGPVQDRIRGQRIAIIGLGGTGSYILDILAKMPVEIHMFDPDNMEWHNLMRAPGAPTAEEIEQIRMGNLRKVDYYLSKYSAFRESIYAHARQVESPESFKDVLAEHPLDYAFVCIDQNPNSDSPRQDNTYIALSEAGVPFVDSGVSITLDGDTIRGTITVSAFDAGSNYWRNAIPNAKVRGNLPGYRNVQLPEVNAEAATLAVMEWRRRTGQYVSEFDLWFYKMRLEKPYIVGVADIPAEVI